MVCGGRARGDAGNHDNLRVATVVPTEEGVTQHHGELGGAERHMCALHVDGADALLQREERLVDLRSLDTALAVIRLRVLGPL